MLIEDNGNQIAKLNEEKFTIEKRLNYHKTRIDFKKVIQPF
jgi:site-specific DNA recombinase